MRYQTYTTTVGEKFELKSGEEIISILPHTTCSYEGERAGLRRTPYTEVQKIIILVRIKGVDWEKTND